MLDNPFPAIMGRVCYHPCQTACNRGQLDDAVGINSVERFLGDEAIAREWTVTVDAPLGAIPMFARAGGVIPMQQLVEHTGQAPIDPLTFEIYPGAKSTRQYYEDDGITMEYQRGKYLLQKINVEDAGNQVGVNISAR